MELNIKVKVHTPADVLRYARAGAMPVDTAARTCLKMSGWTEKEIDSVLPQRKPAKKRTTAKKTGRPSAYESRKGELGLLVEQGTSVATMSSVLGVSVPTVRAWLSRYHEDQAPAEAGAA